MRLARDRAVDLFRRRYGGAPTALVRAPGRVNLIGEHTDYNDGLVLPMAIDREVCIAIRPRPDAVVTAFSEGFDEPARIAVDRFDSRADGWSVYLQGVAWALAEGGLALRGWDGAVASDVPVGAGLSSSAALELAAARAFQVVGGFAWDPVSMARAGRRAENDWVGLASGIMDQLVSAAGRAGHALLIDCRSLDHEAVPLPREVAVVIMDTGTRRELAGSAYNERREQCSTAARQLGLASLRDLPEADLDAARGILGDVVFRRARHVVTENARTAAAAAALRSGDAATAGRHMTASHRSLRDDFEVSSDAFDAIVAAAQAVEGCHGARMTGGGFAGCAVAIVDAGRCEAFIAAVARDYKAASGRQPTLYRCMPTDGASVLPDPEAGP